MTSRGRMMAELVLAAQREKHVVLRDRANIGNEKEENSSDSEIRDFDDDVSINDPSYFPEDLGNEMLVEEVDDKENRTEGTGKENSPKKRKKSTKEVKLLPACKCRKKCGEKYNLILNRQEILKNYNKYTFAERRLFLDKYLSQSIVSTKTTSLNPNKRNKTITYSLPSKNINESAVNVCKVMFLHTLGFKTDGFITQHFKSRKKLGYVDIMDKRGAARSEKLKIVAKIKEDRIAQFIEKYNPVVSHYNILHSPNRRYLPPELSIAYLHREYNKIYKNEIVSYENFRSAFKKLNIGFSAPSQDECPTCSKHRQHVGITAADSEENFPTPENNEQPTCSKYLIPEINNPAPADDLNLSNVLCPHGENDCDTCSKYADHKKRYTEARAAYKRDKETKWPETHNVYCVDMQKILILPKMTIKNSYFVSRLIVMHETFASMHGGKNKCVLWHEGIIGRNAPQVASAYYKIILSAPSNVKTFIFWADNCSAQNKNWILLSMFSTLVNLDWGPEKIGVKYFEPGHSYMKCDSIHGRIGTLWKKQPEILDMLDLIEVIRAADKSNEVMLLTAQDFYKFEDGCKIRRKNDQNENKIPLLENIRQVEFRKGSRSMFYKEHFTEIEFQETKFLKKNFNPTIPAGNESDNGINAAKLSKIKKELLPHMHPKKRIFWNNLQPNENAQDLCKFSANE